MFPRNYVLKIDNRKKYKTIFLYQFANIYYNFNDIEVIVTIYFMSDLLKYDP